MDLSDMDLNAIESGEVTVKGIEVNQPSNWECYLTPDLILNPTMGNEPNWFNRKMQELCFGFKWREKG